MSQRRNIVSFVVTLGTLVSCSDPGADSSLRPTAGPATATTAGPGPSAQDGNALPSSPSATPTSDPTTPPSDDAGERGADAGPGNDGGRDDSGPGIFVAVGYGGRRARSLDDGRTWVDDVSVVPQGGDDQNLFRTVVYGDGRFVALGWRSASSLDGKTWTAITPSFVQWIGAGAWTPSTGFVAVGGYGMRAVSADAVTWRNNPIDTVATHPHDALALGNGKLFSTNDGGERTFSVDGARWQRSSGESGVRTDSIAFGGGVVVAVGDNGAAASRSVRSVDGGATYGGVVNIPAQVEGLIFAQNRFLTLADGAVFTSMNGTSWTRAASANARRARRIAFGHGAYVAVTRDGLIRSTDAVTWSAPLPRGANPFESVTFGPR